MARIAVATLQTVWDCRWSRPGCRLVDVADSKQPEAVWVCVRSGRRRAVTDEECRSCEKWEHTSLPSN
jgi:hypothetical protein